MIEPIMYLAIGFLVSMLFGLMIVPLVHNRAVRLTTRRLEAATPLSMAEIQADKQAELARINHELNDRAMTADSRQVELVAVRTQIDELKGRVGDAEKEFSTTQARLAQERADSERATRELSEARSRVENLSQRVTDLDRQLIVQVKEAEMLGNRVNDLEARLATQGKLLAEREYENNQLRQANENTERAARELREEIAATSGGKSPIVEKLRSEKAAVEEQLRVARDERAKLQRDINAIQQQAENSWQ